MLKVLSVLVICFLPIAGLGTTWSNHTPKITSTIIAFSEEGSAIYGDCDLSDCDLFGNPNGDWVGSIADQLAFPLNLGLDLDKFSSRSRASTTNSRIPVDHTQMNS